MVLDESVQSGEDVVVHHQLSLVHGHGLEGPGDLDKPVELGHVLPGLVEHLQVVGPAEAPRGGVLLGDHGEDLEERSQEPALVGPGPVVDDDLLGPLLALLVLELPDRGGTLQHEVTAAARLLAEGDRRVGRLHGYCGGGGEDLEIRNIQISPLIFHIHEAAVIPEIPVIQ